ncbi:MAG: N-acetylglucosamine kinase [Erysipelotrichaceae bacterium]
MAKVPFQQNLITHIIGVDGGGTKTVFVLYTKEGAEEARVELGTCHFAQIGFDQVGLLLKEGIEVLLHAKHLQKDQVLVGLGLAGYGREARVRNALEASLDHALNGYHYVLANDVEVALLGALGGQEGIVLISGTGSIALAKKGNDYIRCGGWGYLLGDEGSGYDLGRKTLSLFAKQADGRVAKGALYDLIVDHYDLDQDFDLTGILTNDPSRTHIASFATFAYQAALAKDASAIALYEQAALELGLLANTLAKQFDGVCPLSYVGGVFRSGDLILQPLQQCLVPQIQLQAPQSAPEYGAYLLANQTLHRTL